jgi:hypothetical protein
LLAPNIVEVVDSVNQIKEIKKMVSPPQREKLLENKEIRCFMELCESLG